MSAQHTANNNISYPLIRQLLCSNSPVTNRLVHDSMSVAVTSNPQTNVVTSAPGVGVVSTLSNSLTSPCQPLTITTLSRTIHSTHYIIVNSANRAPKTVLSPESLLEKIGDTRWAIKMSSDHNPNHAPHNVTYRSLQTGEEVIAPLPQTPLMHGAFIPVERVREAFDELMAESIRETIDMDATLDEYYNSVKTKVISQETEGDKGTQQSNDNRMDVDTELDKLFTDLVDAMEEHINHRDPVVENSALLPSSPSVHSKHTLLCTNPQHDVSIDPHMPACSTSFISRHKPDKSYSSEAQIGCSPPDALPSSSPDNHVDVQPCCSKDVPSEFSQVELTPAVSNSCSNIRVLPEGPRPVNVFCSSYNNQENSLIKVEPIENNSSISLRDDHSSVACMPLEDTVTHYNVTRSADSVKINHNRKLDRTHPRKPVLLPRFKFRELREKSKLVVDNSGAWTRTRCLSRVHSDLTYKLRNRYVQIALSPLKSKGQNKKS